MKEQISYQKETEWTDKGLRDSNIIKGLMLQHLPKPLLFKKQNKTKNQNLNQTLSAS